MTLFKSFEENVYINYPNNKKPVKPFSGNNSNNFKKPARNVGINRNRHPNFSFLYKKPLKKKFVNYDKKANTFFKAN